MCLVGGEGWGRAKPFVNFPEMAYSGHSVLDLKISGRHLAALEEKTLIRYFNDLTRRFKIALTIRLNVYAFSK